MMEDAASKMSKDLSAIVNKVSLVNDARLRTLTFLADSQVAICSAKTMVFAERRITALSRACAPENGVANIANCHQNVPTSVATVT